MAIIISKNGMNAEKVNQSNFTLEDKLQEYIYNNPDTIPLYEIDEDTRLFIAAREFGTKSGPIDALGFDARGNIYVVETKLYKNADKRTVVAQALDYGSSLWRHATDFDTFIQQLDMHTQKHFGKDFRDKYAEFFGLEDTAESMQAIRGNLSDGFMKFVVLMDRLHDALKDLVMFVNQNSKFDLYAVELEYYVHDSFEIIIPKLYGAEVKKTVSTAANSAVSWVSTTEEEYLEKLKVNTETSPHLTYDQALQIHELNKVLSAKTEGHIEYTVSPAKPYIIKALMKSDDNWNYAFDTSGTLSFYLYKKENEQVRVFRRLLDHLIENNLFGKKPILKDKAQFFITQAQVTAALDIDKLIELYQLSIDEVLNHKKSI
jgi:hypothetical protein